MKNICGVRGSEKRYDEYHRMYRRCDVCNTKLAPKYYYKERDITLEQKKKSYHNNREKIFDLEKNMRITHESEIDELNIKNQALTQAVETLKTTISVA